MVWFNSSRLDLQSSPRLDSCIFWKLPCGLPVSRTVALIWRRTDFISFMLTVSSNQLWLVMTENTACNRGLAQCGLMTVFLQLLVFNLAFAPADQVISNRNPLLEQSNNKLASVSQADGTRVSRTSPSLYVTGHAVGTWYSAIIFSLRHAFFDMTQSITLFLLGDPLPRTIGLIRIFQ